MYIKSIHANNDIIINLSNVHYQKTTNKTGGFHIYFYSTSSEDNVKKWSYSCKEEREIEFRFINSLTQVKCIE